MKSHQPVVPPLQEPTSQLSVSQLSAYLSVLRAIIYTPWKRPQCPYTCIQCELYIPQRRPQRGTHSYIRLANDHFVLGAIYTLEKTTVLRAIYALEKRVMYMPWKRPQRGSQSYIHLGKDHCPHSYIQLGKDHSVLRAIYALGKTTVSLTPPVPPTQPSLTGRSAGE